MMKRIADKLFRTDTVGGASTLQASNKNISSILDVYIKTAPIPQTTIDIFKDEWSSRLPGLQSGNAGLFEDSRVKWADAQLGGFKNLHVLELGPLEAGHTYILEQLGAASITAVEANTRAYLKCLVVKELFKLQRAQFLCGDFVEYLRNPEKRFDVCLASGVLYHMRHPMELLDLISQVADKVFLWTHYYHGSTIESNPNLAPKFTTVVESEYKGLKYTSYKNDYLNALDWKGFCGGSAEYSFWLEREDIIRGLKHFGFKDIRIAFEDITHVNGPSFAVAAMRS